MVEEEDEMEEEETEVVGATMVATQAEATMATTVAVWEMIPETTQARAGDMDLRAEGVRMDQIGLIKDQEEGRVHQQGVVDLKAPRMESNLRQWLVRNHESP